MSARGLRAADRSGFRRASGKNKQHLNGLLNSLTDALQNSGVDLTQATISVQVDFGKRANRGLTSTAKIATLSIACSCQNTPYAHLYLSRNHKNHSSSEESTQGILVQ